MNKLIIIILVLVCGFAHAQVDRSKAPKPAPAREIKIGDYQAFALKNGLQVFVVENHKLPRVQFSLQLKNDPIMEKEKTGHVELTGQLIGTGTKTRTKAQLDEEVDFIGATLNTSWNSIFASSLTKHRDKLLELMSDVLFNPAFDPNELAKLKTQKLSELASDKDDPTSIMANVRTALVYGKEHTYGEIETEQTIEAFTLEDCKNYFNTYFKPNNAYLVIVGDIDLKTANTAAEKYFGKWTQGTVTNPTYKQPAPPAKTYVALVDRPNSVQSVISVAYPVNLKTGSQEAIKARVLNQILGGSFSARLMQNLREAHGYTYGASSQLNSDFLVGLFQAGASVRNEVTDSSVMEVMNELNRIVNEPVKDNELAAAKASIAGAFGRSLESPQTIATFAVNTAKYNLPKDYYNNYLKSIDAVNVNDVQATAKQFILPGNSHIIVVGKGSEVADKLKPFGEIKYFDIYGKEMAPAKASALPAGLTAEKVIGKYIEAIGGEKNVKAVKAMKMTMTGSIQGQDLLFTVIMKAPGKMVQEVSAGGQVFQRTVTDGKEIATTTMGQKETLDERAKEGKLFDAAIFKEVEYPTYKVKAVLKSVEIVDGKEAYVVEYTTPQGEKTSDYYDKETGLKVQSVAIQKGPQGEAAVATKFGDYKEVKGVKFPHSVSQAMGPMSLKFDAQTLEVNPTVEDAIFKVQ
jgi:predicted Zn-dependent peptidase